MLIFNLNQPLRLLCELAAGFFLMASLQQVNAAPEGAHNQKKVGKLVLTGPMGSARAAHTATALPDGHVLLAGGISAAANAPGSAELFDPSADAFVSTGPMQTPRQSHTATLLLDGQVLITGGYDAKGGYLSSAERYDPVSKKFTLSGTMHIARAGHVAARLADGRVLLVGGVGKGWTFLSSAEIYDPKTGEFTATGAMRLARESHVAVALNDGRILIIGGHQGRRSNIELHRSIEVYDPVSARFNDAGEMKIRRHKHDAVLLRDDRVLITGGTDERDYNGRYNSAEFFDPHTGLSELTAKLQLPRYKHAGTSMLLSDGRVLLAGGAHLAEVFDPGLKQFLLVNSDVRMVGQFSAAVLLPDGRVLITGGYGEGFGAQAAAWLYQP